MENLSLIGLQNNMTDQEINKTIAEVCGWKEVEPWLNGDRCFEFKQSVCGYRIEDLPDYCNSLDAIHEVEKTLTSIEQEEYWDFLWNLTGSEFELCHANARQRAEAFLKTVGKWEK